MSDLAVDPFSHHVRGEPARTWDLTTASQLRYFVTFAQGDQALEVCELLRHCAKTAVRSRVPTTRVRGRPLPLARICGHSCGPFGNEGRMDGRIGLRA